MNINRIRLLASGLLAALIGAQPMCTLVVNASTDQINANTQSRMIAARMGVDELMLQDTAAYQARELEQERIQHDAALAELDRANTPSPEKLAAAKAQASAVKTAHATASFAGTVNTMTDIGAGLSRFEAGLSAGQASTASRAVFKAYAVQVSSALDSLSRLADAERARIAPADAQAHTRLNAFENHMQLALRQLQHELAPMPDEAAGASTWQTYATRVTAALDSAGLGAQRAPAKPAPAPFGELRANASALPANRADYVAADPSFTAAALLQDYMSHPARLDSLLSALSQIQGVFKSASTGPTPADLAETPDIHFTPRLQALSNSLGSALSMFTYVRDHVDSELYYGSKKGSTGALYEMGGNDADQASLLIALLRSANIPAHYAIGTVRLSGQQAMDLARTQTVASAANAMGTAGIPALIETVNGVPQYVDIQHVWVQAWLPYERYRGVFEKPAASAWIDLDPFIKTYAFNTPVNLTTAAPFNAAAYLSGPYTHTLPLDYWENGLRAYVQANGLDCTTLDAAMRFRAILPGNLELLPSQLPVTPLIVYGTPSSLNSTQRYTLQVALQDEFGATSLSYNAELPSIYGQRIDLSYVPATVADQTTINNAGGLLKTPPYLVHLVPTLSVSETVVASGADVVAGTTGSLQASFTTPGIASDVPDMSHAVTAGGLYVVGLDYQSVPQQLVDDAQVRNAALAPTSPNAQAQKLWITLLDYFREVNRGRDQSAGILQTWYVRDLGAGYASQEMRADTLYSSPVALHDNGVQIDVPKLTFDFYDLEDGGQARSFAVKQIFGFNTSALEHTIIQKEFNQEGISAVKALQLAALAGQTLITVTNASQLTPLGVSQGAKDGILNALNRGWQAIVSQNPVSLFKWHGEGYIVYDPVLGSAGYIISGGLNGGSGTGGGSGGGNCGSGSSSACGDDDISWLDPMIDTVVQTISGDPVNLSNGNFLLSATDLMVQEPNMPLGLRRHYNAIDAAVQNRHFGWGWFDSFDAHITPNPDNSLSLFTDNGHEYVYAPDGLGGFQRPPGFHEELGVVNSGYLVTDTNGIVNAFSPDGRLLGLRDMYGHTNTLVYSGTLLSVVTDELGRTALAFDYNGSGRIIAARDLTGNSTQYGYDALGNLSVVTDSIHGATHYAYDASHRLTQWMDPTGALNTYEYDADGRAQRHTDPQGQVESFSYDSYTGQAVVTDKAGNDTIYTLDERGRTTAKTDPMGNTARNVWDNDDNTTAAVDARGHVVTSAYDANGLLQAQTDAAGNVTTITRDAAGWETGKTELVNGQVVTDQITYDANHRVQSETDMSGRTTTYTRDPQGRAYLVSDAAGGQKSFAYAADGAVLSHGTAVHDSDGNAMWITTTYSYDARNHLSGITDPSGKTVTDTTDALGHMISGGDGNTSMAFGVDALGRLSTITHSNGFTTSAAYDSLGRIAETNNTSGQDAQYTYNAFGQVATFTDWRGHVTRMQYDTLGRETRQINPDGSAQGMSYCVNQTSACQSVDENGVTSSQTFDPLQQPVAVTDGAGHVTSLRYDELGRVISQTDPLGNTTLFSYDPNGNLIEVVDALNHPTLYTYDARNHLTAITDANGHVHHVTFDESGQLVKQGDALGHAARTYYAGNGKVTKMIDANGTVNTYAYDGHGNLHSISNVAGADTYAYDGNNKMIALNSPATAIGYQRDSQGRMISLTQTISGSVKSLAWTYTPFSLPESQTDAEGNRTTYRYDTMNRLSSISNSQGGETDYAYDAGGRRIKTRLPNGLTTYYSWDNNNQLAAQVTRNSQNAVVAAFSYTYDAAGRRASMADYAGAVTSYAYDALNRLTGANTVNGRQESFTYDNAGNRLNHTVNGVTTTYSYDIADRLTGETTAGNTTTYAYDASGNMISRALASATTTYAYDGFNQLSAIVAPDGSRWDFGYAADGSRSYARFTPLNGAPSRTDFLLRDKSVVADYIDGGATVTHYLRGPVMDELLGQETNGKWIYYVQDALQSVVLATDSAGQVIGRRSYDAYGAVLNQSGVWPGRYGYTGREDIGATELLYYRARVYDPTAGRFTSSDPVFGSLNHPSTLQRYLYVDNDPVNLVDPTGQSAIKDPGTIFSDWLFTSFGVDVLKNGLKLACTATKGATAYCTQAVYIIDSFEMIYTSLSSTGTLISKYMVDWDIDRAIIWNIFWVAPATYAAIWADTSKAASVNSASAIIHKLLQKAIGKVAELDIKLFGNSMGASAMQVGLEIDVWKILWEILQFYQFDPNLNKFFAGMVKILMAPEIALIFTWSNHK